MSDPILSLTLAYGGYIVTLYTDESEEAHVFTDLDNALAFIKRIALNAEAVTDDESVEVRG